MSSQTTPDNLEGRKSWSLKMQERFAIDIYKAYWCISEEQITEVDAYAEHEEAAMAIDASGIDKVVEPATGVRHIAQRFRTLREFKNGKVIDPDFSIRISTYGGHETEYDKLLNAYRNNGNVPKIYTFGIGASVSKEDCLQSGFKDFYFLKLERFLKLLDSNKLQASSSRDNKDGSKGLYFHIQDLRDNYIIQDEISGSVLASCWNGDRPSDDFPTAPGIKNTGQVKISDFGGGD